MSIPAPALRRTTSATASPLVAPTAAGILHLGLGSFHRAHQAVYTAAALQSAGGDWGIIGVWCGLAGLIGVRLTTCAVRFAGERWALTGSALP